MSRLLLRRRHLRTDLFGGVDGELVRSPSRPRIASFARRDILPRPTKFPAPGGLVRRPGETAFPHHPSAGRPPPGPDQAKDNLGNRSNFHGRIVKPNPMRERNLGFEATRPRLTVAYCPAKDLAAEVFDRLPRLS